MGYLAWSLFWGGRAGRNPWQATGLEWRTTSPPPPKNFDTMPRVIEGPYHYHPEETGPAPEHPEPHRKQGDDP